MSFANTWINPYNSLMKLTQDPVSGALTGSYSSTTDGSGTYDVTGWASLADATTAAGQTMAISILWRSNDGGISDPSHEVSAMAGQVVAVNPGENLVLVHIFVETKTGVTPKRGIYPDKLVFTPTTLSPAAPANPAAPIPVTKANSGYTDNLSGVWNGKTLSGQMQITFRFPVPGEPQLEGCIVYGTGHEYPITGFTDIFAEAADFEWQGITFSTYIDSPDGRLCISMAGYLSLKNHIIHFTSMVSQSTPSNSTWYQVAKEQWIFAKKAK